MPAERRRQTRNQPASDTNNRQNNLPPDNPLFQLQQAVQQESPGNPSPSNASATVSSSTPPANATRRPLIAGTSLRDIVAVDTSTVDDLSWHQNKGADSHVGLDPNGQPWRYPRYRRGKKDGSNLDGFKDEIEERTKNGQGCLAIAKALIAKGIETDQKAVGRVRLKWGIRQRAPKKMTEQGIANIRKAHEVQKNLKADIPDKIDTVRFMRKAEITRMTREGMSSAEIAENFIQRGVKLKRGAGYIERMRTVWGLEHDPQNNVQGFRQRCRTTARRAQKEQFENIATELGIEDVDTWVTSKMDEQVAADARLEHAYKLMGDLRPKPVDRNIPKLFRPKRKYTRRKKANVFELHVPDNIAELSAAASPLGGAGASGATVSVAAGSDSPQEIIELSDDEDEDEDEDDEDEDDEDEDNEDGSDENELEDDSMDVDGDAGDDQQMTTQDSTESQQAPAVIKMEVDHSASVLQSAAQPQSNGHQIELSSATQSASPALTVPTPQPTAAPDTPMPPPPPIPNGDITSQARPPGTFNQATFAPVAVPAPVPTPQPAQPPPRPRLLNIAPRPPPGLLVHGVPSAGPPPEEAKYMAQFGLYAFPNYNPTIQKYGTPRGQISVQGYEYLPLPHPPLPRPPIFVSVAPGQATSVGNALPPAPSAPPRVSNIPAPPLVIPPQQIEKHKQELKAMEGYHKATQWCMDLLAARAESRPIAGSLTGLPPSLKDIQNAKEKIKEAATIMLATW